MKQFGALKAIGVTNWRITGMILLQVLTVGAMGFSLGSGLCAAFFAITLHNPPTRGLVLIWENALYTSENQLAQSEASVAINLVALYKALGGGW